MRERSRFLPSRLRQVWACHSHYLAHLFEKILVVLHSSGCIDQHGVYPVSLCVVHRVKRNCRWVGTVLMFDYPHSDATSMLFELLYRARAVGVASRQNNSSALFLEDVREFCYARCFSSAIDSYED